MLLKIQHLTRYEFSDPVHFALSQIRKTPKTTAAQTVTNWSTTVTGGRKELAFEDHHLNLTELISYGPDVTVLEILSQGEVTVRETHGVIGKHRGPAPLWLYQRATPRTRAGRGVQAIVRGVKDLDGLDAMHALSAAIADQITYEVGASRPDWTAEDAITAQRGVCQDHTHVFLACARALGRPARYVSGYLMMDDRVAQNAMHAWAEAHLDGLGWVGFDASNGISPDARYVRVATGLDYADAAPITGTRVGGADEELAVKIEVAQQ